MSDIEETENHSEDEDDDFPEYDRYEGAKVFRGNFFLDSILTFVIEVILVIIALFIMLLNYPDSYDGSVDSVVMVEARLIDYGPCDSTRGIGHFLTGEDWYYFEEEGKRSFYTRQFTDRVNDIARFEREIDKGTKFYLWSDFRYPNEGDALFIRDEYGHEYYSQKDAFAAYESSCAKLRDRMKQFFKIIFGSVVVTIFTLRYADKLPFFLVWYPLLRGTPAERLADALPPRRKRLKRKIMAQVEKNRKKVAADRAKRMAEKESEQKQRVER